MSEVEELDLQELVEDAADLEEEESPLMGSPEWHDYVMKHFEFDELDEKGNPFVAGLRRVARTLLGPILESKAKLVQSPLPWPGKDSLLTPTTVEYTVAFLWCRTEDMPDGATAYRVEFADVADVYHENTDKEFCKFPSAVAATRAEGRCLRKALQLKRVIAAEEAPAVPTEKNKFITGTQKHFIELLCGRCGIEVERFINSGKKRYDSIDDIPYEIAAKMNQALSGYQTNPDTIPSHLLS